MLIEQTILAEVWETVGSFAIKRLINQTNSYLAGRETEVIRIAPAKSRKMYKINFRTRTIINYQLTKNQAKGGGSRCPNNSFYREFWKQRGKIDQYFYFDDYALIVTDTTLEVYRKK